MSRKLSLASLAGITLAGGMMGAQAAPFALPGGPIYFQFNNVEQISPTESIVAQSGATELNWGVFNVSSMQNGAVAIPNKDIAGGPAFFADDGPGGASGQVTGIFWGVKLHSVAGGGAVPLVVNGSDGFIDLWWNDPGSDDITAADLAGTGVAPGDRLGTDPNGDGILDNDIDPTVARFTTGTFLARLEFASGIIDGSASIDINGNFFGGTITGSGLADSFANVVDVNGDGVIDALDGVWASALDQDWFIVHDGAAAAAAGIPVATRDLRFSNFTNGLPSWDGAGDIAGLRSNDPGRAFVPEPTSLALLGLGLVGLGFGARRRKSA